MKQLFTLLMLGAFVLTLTTQCKATQKANKQVEKNANVSVPTEQETPVHVEEATVVPELVNDEEQELAQTEIEAEIETEIEAETQEVEATTKEPASVPTGLHYRVQVAATLSPPTHYREAFAGLHAAMPQLKMEVTHDSDGYYRYVTLPYVA
jgi:hypothetical protein